MRMPAEAVDGRSLEIDEGQVGVLEQGAHGTDLARPPHDRQRVAGRRAAAPTNDLREAPVPGIVPALALSDRAPIDRSVEHHVATGHQGPGRCRVERRRVDARRGRYVQRPVGNVAEAVVPEQVETVQGEGAHVRRHLAGRE